jgi:hypothetical protein
MGGYIFAHFEATGGDTGSDRHLKIGRVALPIVN